MILTTNVFSAGSSDNSSTKTSYDKAVSYINEAKNMKKKIRLKNRKKNMKKL